MPSVAEIVRMLEAGVSAGEPGPECDTDWLKEQLPALRPVTVDHTSVGGPMGEMPARCYRGPQTRAGLVWVHGGGWIGGDLAMPEANWVGLALAAQGIAVVSIEYHKALHGVRFPTPSDDVLAGWLWASRVLTGVSAGVSAGPVATGPVSAGVSTGPVATGPVSAGPVSTGPVSTGPVSAGPVATGPGATGPVFTAPIHLGGASAGANLVAGGTKRLRDEAGPSPASLVLAYPLVHPAIPEWDRAELARIRRDAGETFFDDVTIRDLTLQYAGSEGALADPYAFAANGDVTGQPPVFILNCEIDSLRSSGEAYGRQLAAAGVTVEVDMVVGATHGSLNRPMQPEGPDSVNRIARWILASSPPPSTVHAPGARE